MLHPGLRAVGFGSQQSASERPAGPASWQRDTCGERRERLPRIGSLPRPVRARHLSGLIPHLDVPISALLPILPVPVSLLLDEFPGLGIPHGLSSVPCTLLALAAPPGLPRRPGVGHGARAPGPHVQAGRALVRLARAGPAHLELRQVGAARAAEPGRRCHVAGAVLEPAAARLGALGPGGELGHDAVLRAGDEAGLLQQRLGLEVLADDILRGAVFLLLHARDLSHLNAFCPLHARQGLLQAFGDDGLTRTPGSQPPVVQLFVPVTDSEAMLLVAGSLGLLAVCVQRRPSFHMRTPHRPGLDASWAAFISHASAPGT